MQRRPISFPPAPVAPLSFRGSADAASTCGFEEDDAATVIWQGSRAFASSPQQEWSETPMAFEAAAARAPTAMASVAPMEMDLQHAPAPRRPRKTDVVAWLPLASASCVGVALAALLFAIALTSFGKPSNAAPGASFANAPPTPATIEAPPVMPVVGPTGAEPVSPTEETTKQVQLPTEVQRVKQPRPHVTAIAPPSTQPATEARVTAAATPRNVIVPDGAPRVPAEPSTKKSNAPRVDDEAVSAQKMLEEARRETAGAL